MRKVLVAIDGSESASRVIEYCGKQFSGMSDLSLTLFHVLPKSLLRAATVVSCSALFL